MVVPRTLWIGACAALAVATGAHAEVWQPAAGHAQIALWPGTRAGGESLTVETRDGVGDHFRAIHDVARPTVTVYAAKPNPSGAAVVVFPGGGYKELAIDLEGTEVCDWLNRRGITCIVLKYRVPDSGPHWDARCGCQAIPARPLALEDAQRALGVIRAHAAAWHIDPHKLGVLGFSAGGHLVANLSTHFTQRAYAAIDAADQQSCRPDFAIALYPGHLWMDERKLELTPDVPVSAQTPPTFLLQAENDPVDDVNHSLVYYAALKNAGVPTELHLFAQGGHAFGVRPTGLPISSWPQLVETWLHTIGVLARP